MNTYAYTCVCVYVHIMKIATTPWVLQPMIVAILCMSMNDIFCLKNEDMLVLSLLGWLSTLWGCSSFTKPQKTGFLYVLKCIKWGVRQAETAIIWETGAVRFNRYHLWYQIVFRMTQKWKGKFKTNMSLPAVPGRFWMQDYLGYCTFKTVEFHTGFEIKMVCSCLFTVLTILNLPKRYCRFVWSQ